MIGSTHLSIGADSMYGTNSSLGTNSSPGIGSTFEPTPSDSDSISYDCGANSSSGSRKRGIITSLAEMSYKCQSGGSGVDYEA